VTTLARDLASDFRVLEPFQRRGGDLPLSVDVHVEDLAQVFPRRAPIVGWSWGAMLALSFAARHPGRASSLVLVGCGTYDSDSRAAYHEAMTQRLGLAGRLRVEELERRLAVEKDRARRDHLFGQLAETMTRAQAFDSISKRKDVVAVDSLGFEETWQDVLRVQSDGIEPAAFAAITAPVLMIHGDDDPHPGRATRDTLQRHIPHLEYHQLRRCGHTPWLERQARDLFLATLRYRLLGS
jgi:pimeloyl-ACP methyl ester carboxylesterase